MFKELLESLVLPSVKNKMPNNWEWFIFSPNLVLYQYVSSHWKNIILIQCTARGTQMAPMVYGKHFCHERIQVLWHSMPARVYMVYGEIVIHFVILLCKFKTFPSISQIMTVKRPHEQSIDQWPPSSTSVNGEVTEKQLPATDIGSNTKQKYRKHLCM
jgi:hypothetical protein